MAVKKQFLKGKPVCKVTFRLSEQIAESANKVQLLGDFNNWSLNSEPMKKLKTGEFTATVNLEKNKDYQYRYLIDNERWENDTDADKYVPNAFASVNSVISV